MGSPQTLSEADRRLLAAWAADCAARVLGVFEAEAPGDDRPRMLIARARAFARGESGTAEAIRRRFVGGVGAGEVTPAAAAAARAAGQAVAVCHMGAHALGAAAYAVRAVGLANPDRPGAVEDEIRWQLGHMSGAVRAAGGALPPVGEDPSGPLGPGLLASGELGAVIRALQAALSRSGAGGRPRVRRLGEPSGSRPGVEQPGPLEHSGERLPAPVLLGPDRPPALAGHGAAPGPVGEQGGLAADLAVVQRSPRGLGRRSVAHHRAQVPRAAGRQNLGGSNPGCRGGIGQRSSRSEPFLRPWLALSI